MFATISGAHLYGFPSPDSDYDLRGAHVLPLDAVVGLEVRDETVEDSRIIDGLEMDMADAQFVDPAQGDYRVKEGSPALSLGFVNFQMDRFGVQRPALKALARTPVLPGQKPAGPSAR